MSKKVAIVLGNYKEYVKKYGPDCIESLRKQDWEGEMKIFVYDNETSEESFKALKEIMPEAELVLNKNNDGFAKGNNDCLKLALAQGFDYLILFNMDMIIGPSAVRKMVEVAEMEEKNAVVQARIMLHPRMDLVNSLGNATHFLGFGYCVGYNKEYKESVNKYEEINYPSGAAVLFKREVLEKIGLFDEEFWMYNEDQDLGWRAWIAGFKCVMASEAIAYHKYEFGRSISKYYWMDRNRVMVMLKNYKALTLLLILPPFLFMEFGLILFSLKSGWFKDKARIWLYFLNPSKLLAIWGKRQEVNAIRVVKDKDIVKNFAGEIWYQEVDDVKLRLVNPVFNFYWNCVRKIIFW